MITLGSWGIQVVELGHSYFYFSVFAWLLRHSQKKSGKRKCRPDRIVGYSFDQRGNLSVSRDSLLGIARRS